MTPGNSESKAKARKSNILLVITNKLKKKKKTKGPNTLSYIMYNLVMLKTITH